MEYWHNPRCTKSREALALLREKGVEPEVREYLKTPPSEAELKALIGKLGLASARDLMRTKEALYKELGLKDETDEDRLVAAMAENPKLIERPVLINGAKAAIGRPPAEILDAL
ncbi:arsenate reductase (glutaredoxin) [Marinicauda salina]|uniref:Arsenate reductase n=1 Tax=Marinicauda salina TaxID=2135793 RepID=A0A2U2BW67_9PROT|nr:arsenate reductase (glutaredoxin) [Marinicauda salina]PWE18265.1 arsenate reductase (glutaredoxin) [Marinicauda salina]